MDREEFSGGTGDGGNVTDLLYKIAEEARGLAVDATCRAGSGHLGTPFGCAEIGAFLFGRGLHYCPHNPRWINRDRFVLSAGHGSIFLYTWLHLSGFDVTLEDLKAFRQLRSRTPGHPEFGVTPGVETSTGALGQGVGNAVGMAVSLKMAAARFNTERHAIFGARVVCLCGDGCLQEGVAQESISLAGHWGLDNLVLMYDSNQMTLDAPLSTSQSEDVARKFEALGWRVQTIDGHDIGAIEGAFQVTQNGSDRPQLIILNTLIGRGIPSIEGTRMAHGAAGTALISEIKAHLGLPQESFYVSEETRRFFEKRRREALRNYGEWEKMFSEWRAENPEWDKLLLKNDGDVEWETLVFDWGKNISTRVAAGKILQTAAKKIPLLIGGSADVYESTKNFIEGGGTFARDNFGGRNMHFGVREHAMGAILNGVAYDGLFRASGATFLVFSDYFRPALRLAALARLPVIYFLTHDSVFVGEDGPTHQPVEMLVGLRSIPNVQVLRPADADETLGALQVALANDEGPTLLVLTRQDIPVLNQRTAEEKREGVHRGAYIFFPETDKLEWILVASGSELELALAVREHLGGGARVVSMPSMEIFERQSDDYKAQVFPKNVSRRVAVEASSPTPWYRYVGLDGVVIGLTQFGLSAPQEDLRRHFRFTVDGCLSIIREKYTDLAVEKSDLF